MLVESHFASLEQAGVRDVAGALAFRAIERPQATAAIVLRDGEQEEGALSYAELFVRACSVAASIRRRTSPGDRVVLAFPTGLDFLSALFGCFFAAVIAVPAPPPRGSRGLARLKAICADCAATLILTTANVRAALPSDTPALAVDSIAINEPCEPAAVEPGQIALLQYTSGSTGAPKGVVVSHRAIWHNQSVIRTSFDHAEGVVLVGWLPNFHDMGLIGNLLQPVYAGGLTVMMAPQNFIQKPLRWLRAISRYCAHTSGGPNFAYDLCVAAAADRDTVDIDLSRWRVAFNGAEPIRTATGDAFAKCFAASGFRAESLVNCYGLAEATLMVTGTPVGERAAHFRASRARLGEGALAPPADERDAITLASCGASVSGTTVAIVDPQTHRALPDGCVGEIRVRSDSVCAGYWNEGDTGVPSEAATRWLSTGDLGVREGPRLYVVGRIKDVVIVNGRNLHPADIEARIAAGLAATAPRVLATSVQYASGESLVVFLELERSALQTKDWATWVAAVRGLTGEAVETAPAGVVLLKPGALPLTSSGKFRRKACADLFTEGRLKGIVYMDAGAARLMAAGLAGEPHSR